MLSFSGCKQQTKASLPFMGYFEEYNGIIIEKVYDGSPNREAVDDVKAYAYEKNALVELKPHNSSFSLKLPDKTIEIPFRYFVYNNRVYAFETDKDIRGGDIVFNSIPNNKKQVVLNGRLCENQLLNVKTGELSPICNEEKRPIYEERNKNLMWASVGEKSFSEDGRYMFFSTNRDSFTNSNTFDYYIRDLKTKKEWKIESNEKDIFIPYGISFLDNERLYISVHIIQDKMETYLYDIKSKKMTEYTPKNPDYLNSDKQPHLFYKSNIESGTLEVYNIKTDTTNTLKIKENTATSALLNTSGTVGIGNYIEKKIVGKDENGLTIYENTMDPWQYAVFDIKNNKVYNFQNTYKGNYISNYIWLDDENLLINYTTDKFPNIDVNSPIFATVISYKALFQGE